MTEENDSQQKFLEEMSSEEIAELSSEEIEKLAGKPRKTSGESHNEFGGPTVRWEREQAGVGSHVKISFSTRDRTFTNLEEVKEAAEDLRNVPEWIIGGDPEEVSDALIEAAEEADKPPEPK